MKSMVDIMGKYCTRCGGGIYTSWRTLDSKKFYHPHCFTCVVCGVILDELVEQGEMAALKEIYCHKCYRKCFSGGDDEYIRSGSPNTVNTSPAGERNFNFKEQQSLQNSYHHHQPESERFDFRSQPRSEDQLASNRGNGRSDVNLLYSSQTYNSVQAHQEEQLGGGYIRNSLPLRALPHHMSHTSTSQQGKDLGYLSYGRVAGGGGTDTDNMAQDYYENLENPPKAFLKRQNTACNIRKLERQNSRIPRPTTSTSLSRKSLCTGLGLGESLKSASASKSKVTTSSKSKVGLGNANSSRSSTNNRSNSTVYGSSLSSSSSKVQRSSSWVLPKSSKSKTQDAMGSGQVGSGTRSGTAVAKKAQPTKKRSRPRSATEEKSKGKELASVASHSSGARASVSRRHCAASFSTDEEQYLIDGGGYSDYHHQQYGLAFGTSTSTPQQHCYFETDYPSNEPFQYQEEPSSVVAVPSPKAILSAIGRKNTTTLSKSKRDLSGDIRGSDSASKNLEDAVPTNFAKSRLSFNVTFECPICISSLVPGNESSLLKQGRPFGNGNVVTSCGHLFHRDCLENWLQIKGNKRCPICSSLCLPETLQPVYLECNVSADLDSKSMNSKDFTNETSGTIGKSRSYDTAFKALRSEYDLVKAKYNAILAEKNNYSLKVTIANSLQNAYDMECRNRLQLQWENKKLMRQIEALRNSLREYTSNMS